MTDIDFDEIDRAIASATGKQNNASVVAVSPEKKEDKPAPQIVQRSRPTGRVMDIVHPASTPRKPVSINPVVSNDSQASSVPSDVSTDLPESPFIPGAKIDKRPLGGLLSTEDSTEYPEPTPEDVGDSASVETDVLDDSAEMFSAPLPDELQSDIINIETADVELAEVTPVDSTPLSELVSQDTDRADETVSIYDTDTYHKPLAHPQKNQSGLLTTVWIVLIILFGAGIGAAFYFFVLPLL